MNKSDHPDVYKNKKDISTSNQVYVRRNFLNDLLNEQQKTNHVLNETISELKSQYKQHKKHRIQNGNLSIGKSTILTKVINSIPKRIIKSFSSWIHLMKKIQI